MRQGISLVAVALLAALCTAAPGDDAPAAGEEKMAVFMMSPEEKTSVRVAPGQMFALRFQGRPGTGFSWDFAAEPDKKLLEFLGEKAEKPGSGRVGGSEFFVWTFRALAAGEAEIAMKYARSWETGVAPIRTHIFKVTIANGSAEQQDGQA